ncbi:MAG: nucleoside-diphosphate kinase [Deltaproteobacteria bacterium]|nr:nucleoside-diphosphate kinase [Deltaproteobacteria bacterium]MBW2253676.1 nucleoside-diphosphate kinase [Deltaproteobacteria bacterium]
MAIERTLSIIKPDACEQNLIGRIVARFEEGGLRVAAMRKVHLTQAQAEQFYAVHRERPFYADLVQFMTRNPCVVMALEGDDAIARNREIMGATDPAQAAPGTIRDLYGTNVQENAVHGSDSLENAKIEVGYFFPEAEIY